MSDRRSVSRRSQGGGVVWRQIDPWYPPRGPGVGGRGEERDGAELLLAVPSQNLSRRSSRTRACT